MRNLTIFTGICLLALSCAEKKTEIFSIEQQSVQATPVQGKDVTEQFLNKYEGLYRPQLADDKSLSATNSEETVLISKQGRISFIWARQVADDKNGIPYPTYCSFKETYRILRVLDRNEEDRQAKKPYATHYIETASEGVSLDDSLVGDTTANQNCKLFIQLREPSFDGLYVETLLEEDELRFHKNGGNEAATKSTERPDDSLDENYTRFADEEEAADSSEPYKEKNLNQRF